MKVLFIVPRAKNLFGDEPSDTPVVGGHPNIGVAYLSAALKRHGHRTAVFDDSIEHNHDALLRAVAEQKPDLIGVTIFSYSYKHAYRTVDLIKSHFNIPVVIGGPHIPAFGAGCLKQSPADFAVKGEGEEAIVELVDHLETGVPPLPGITGLIWRNGDKLEINPDRLWRRDLDDVAFPDYDLFDLSRYAYTHQKIMPIITSRGCPYKCNYCSVRLSMGKSFRPRSADNVIAELEHWYQRGWRHFEFNDDCFSFDIGRAENICDGIVERGLKVSWQLYNGIRVDRVSPGLLEKMGKSGCNFISYGCEAGDEKTLRTIRKGITPAQVRQAVEWTSAAGIRNSVNFIVGHPGETYDLAIKSLRFARTLPTDFVNVYNLIPYPGTELFEWIKTHGTFLKSPEIYLGEVGSRDEEPVFETPEFGREERLAALKYGNSLYERTVLRFRLGPVLGYLAYLATRQKTLGKLGRQLALQNAVGNRIYRFLSRSSV